MALDRTLRFFYDVPNQRLVRDFSSDPAPSGDVVLMQGMTYQTEHRFGAYDPVARRWRQLDPSAWDGFKLAFGRMDDRPTAGSWRLTAGVNTSGAIPWDASASQVTTALAAATPGAITGWTVATTVTGIYTFTRTAPGAASLLTVNTAGLAPSSQADVYRLQTGSSTVAEIQEVELFANPAGYQNTWTAMTAGTVNVEVLEAGTTGKNAQQRLTFSTQPVGGGWALKMPNGKVTGVLAHDATPGAIAAAIQQVTGYGTVGEVTVTGGAGEPLVFVFSGSLGGVAQPAMAVQASALEWPKGYRGTLSLATAQAKALTRGRVAPVTITMEALLVVGGEPQPLVQRAAQLKNGLINPTTQAAPVVEPLLTMASSSLGYSGAADSGKLPRFGTIGGLASAGFNAYQVPGVAYTASSFDTGAGVAQRFVYGPASTTAGLSILWNGTLVFGSEAGAKATRANLRGFACITEGLGDALWINSVTYTEFTNYMVHYDPAGAYSFGQIAVPATTVYKISAAVSLDADPAGAYQAKLAIGVNGSPVAAIDERSTGQLLRGSVELPLDAGDNVSVMLWQNSVSSKPVTAWGDCFFSVVEA